MIDEKITTFYLPETLKW